MNVDPEAITVAVCSVGEAGTALDSCLAALSVAGVAKPLVLRAAGAISALRNEALAECSTPVIAFVDDDVVVPDSWLDALVEAWSAAPPKTACIGGPIVSEVNPAGPGWMNASIASAVSADTPESSGQTELSPRITYCGGNVSFNAAALRGIQGFWPAAGAERLRDWFGEEHHAQRELAEVGWEASLEPVLTARRLVGEGATIHRLAANQARSGARRRLLGSGEAAETSAAIKSWSGALVAFAKGNRQLAAERMIRAAGHAGTIAPKLVGGASIEPIASETPFRYRVPDGRTPKGTSSGAVTYCYHRVNDDRIPTGLAVGIDEFRFQLEYLLSTGKPVGAEEAAANRAPSGSFAITFDDGYADNLYEALPILEQYDVPATFFITTGNVESGAHFWWDQLARLMEAPGGSDAPRPVLELTCEGETRAWAPRTPDQLSEARRHIAAWLQSKPPEAIRETIEELENWSGREPNNPIDRPMTPEELKTLASHPLVTLGAHTRTHANLRFCDPVRLADELDGSRTDLERLAGSNVKTIAYPFGVWGADVNGDVAAAAEKAGFEAGFLNGPEPERGGKFVVPRSNPERLTAGAPAK